MFVLKGRLKPFFRRPLFGFRAVCLHFSLIVNPAKCGWLSCTLRRAAGFDSRVATVFSTRQSKTPNTENQAQERPSEWR